MSALRTIYTWVAESLPHLPHRRPPKLVRVGLLILIIADTIAFLWVVARYFGRPMPLLVSAGLFADLFALVAVVRVAWRLFLRPVNPWIR